MVRRAAISLAKSGGNVVMLLRLGRPGLVSKVSILPEDIEASVSNYIHELLHNVTQNFLVDLGSDT